MDNHKDEHSVSQGGNDEAKGMLHWLWLTGLVVAIDLLSKQWASETLQMHQPVNILPMLNFTLSHNYGAAFSFLSDAGGWQRWMLAAIAFFTSVAIAVWMKRLPKHDIWMAVALALILGGAIGNLYDRITLGYVVDFIDCYWGSSHFATFNIADAGISVGAVMMAIDVIRNPTK